MAGAWNALTDHLTEVRRLHQVLGLLHWDQQTYLPADAGADRGAQIQVMTQLLQEKMSAPRVGEWLEDAAGGELDAQQQAGLRNIRRAYDRSVRVPPALAGQFAGAQARGFGAWVQAREAEDFSLFAPVLQELVDLSKQTAAAVDDSRHPYDVQFEQFEPGLTSADLLPLFAQLKTGLRELLEAVGSQPQLDPLTGHWPEGAQQAMHGALAAQMGYSFERGRVDSAIHPFTVTLGVSDVRVTTHTSDDNLLMGLGAAMHELGHALYELGMPRDPLGTGIDDCASLGVHESQSRFWENTIGGSRPFCEWVVGLMRPHLGEATPSAEELFRGQNRIAPSLIRITADEVTYNLHIIIRFELEFALLDGSLAVKDLPEAWNEAYHQTLGVTPDSLKTGVLQDVHWSGGSFGYFPTYTLGNLYAAALRRRMEQDVPDLWEQVGRGELLGVLDWLRSHVHGRGAELDGRELIRDVCGEVDLVETLLGTLWERQGALYGVRR